MSSAQEITKKAKSNLAIALICLPKERKQDMIVFYAFCRVIDDIADDLNIPVQTRRKQLTAWKIGIKQGFTSPDELQSEVSKLIKKYNIPRELFLDLIAGCESDLEPQRFSTWEDLETYTYRVACCVGLISTRIFGCTHPDSEKYAIALGHALQITNILRDVREDLENEKRIYLPLDHLAQFQLTEDDISAHISDERFVKMMNQLADCAEKFYQEAISLSPKKDKSALKSAEAMRKIYYALLQKMRADNFKVFKQRYSISKAHKVAILLRTLLPI